MAADIGNRAGARLRKTFHYPDDSDDSDTDRPELDEQEQDILIRALAAENAARNAQFHTMLRVLPLLTTTAYIAPLFSTPAPRVFPALLAVTALLATGFLVHRLPPAVTGFAALDARARLKAPPLPNAGRRGIIPPRGAARSWSGDSPLERFLPMLNVALALLAALAGLVDRSARHPVWWLDGVLAVLPLGILGVVVAVKMAMAGVDPEAELSALKYSYKGA